MLITDSCTATAPKTGISQARIEHSNITVSNAQRSAAMLGAIFGWHIRWEGPAMVGGYTIHLGDDASYLALYQRRDHSVDIDYAWEKGLPLNHIGIVVGDLDAVEARVVAAGLTPFNHSDYTPGRRFYFLDPDGIEFEVISYAAA